GPLVPVVEQRFDSHLGQRRVNLLRRAHLGLVLDVRWNYYNLERRDGDRPRDAVCVVVGLDGGGERAADSQPIAAHDEIDHLARLSLHLRAHIVAVLRAELKDVADLDSMRVGVRALAAMLAAPVPGLGHADILPASDGEVDSRGDADEMRVYLVCA